MSKKTNILGLWVNLSRAIEIAKVGGHSVSVHYHEDYVEAADDYKKIVDFLSGYFTFVSLGDIQVEIVKPQSYTESRFISFDDWAAEIEEYRAKEAHHDLTLNDPCLALLRTASDRLNFSLLKNETVKKVARTIASMDGYKTLQAQHIAEAIQYQSIDHENSIRALRALPNGCYVVNSSAPVFLITTSTGSGIYCNLADMNDAVASLSTNQGYFKIYRFENYTRAAHMSGTAVKKLFEANNITQQLTY